jgi:phosphatidylinositol-bisphosphatase
MVVCIYGYVGTINSQINSNKIEVHLISRRSIFHSGTRYLTRGIDDNGHVANYVETEQIVKCNQNLFSYLQLRGSVPIFFEQPGISAQTIITRNSEMTTPAFKKHINEIKEDFNYIYLINLMNVNKPNEQIITQNYETQIKNIEVNNCKYLYWDFQNQCKFDNYENLDIFVDNLESVFKIFKYFHEDNKGEILRQQNGIIRTNCLDCLDRTNVIQARIAWRSLERHVKFKFFFLY